MGPKLRYASAMLGLPENEQQKIQPDILSFFDRYPEALARYAAAPLYHNTHSMNEAAILEHGLQDKPSLFPAEEGEFLLRMFDKYGNSHPADRQYIQDRILAGGNIFLSTIAPDPNNLIQYRTAERLMLLMRSMYTLQSKESLSVSERTFAATSLTHHTNRLVKNNPAISSLEINPLAPNVVNERLGRFSLDHFDEEESLQVAENPDGAYRSNIVISGTIDPMYIRIFRRMPLTQEHALAGVYTEATWASSIT